MDNFTVVSNIFVLVAFFLITCPNESDGYPSLNYDWNVESNPRLPSSWRPWNTIETREDKRRENNIAETTTLYNDIRDNFNSTDMTGLKEAAPVVINGDHVRRSVQRVPSQKKLGKLEESYAQKRFAPLMKGRKNDLNEILFGGKPTAIIVWPFRV